MELDDEMQTWVCTGAVWGLKAFSSLGLAAMIWVFINNRLLYHVSSWSATQVKAQGFFELPPICRVKDLGYYDSVTSLLILTCHLSY